MLTQIINARILTPQGWLKDGSVIISDNKILEVTNCDLAIVGAKLIDAKGMYIVPGGVEIHVHGGGGRDFMEGSEDAFRAAIKAHIQGSHAAWNDKYFPYSVVFYHSYDTCGCCNNGKIDAGEKQSRSRTSS